MSQTFPAHYYDGTAAKPKQATAQISNKRLMISAEDGARRELYEQELNVEQVGESRLLIRFGNQELLDLRSAEFVKQFRTEFPKAKGSNNILESIANSKWKGVAIIIGLLAGFILLIFLVVIPWIADLGARFFPQKYEVEIGKVLFEKTTAMYAIDSGKTALLNDLVKHVDFKSDYDLNIVVVDQDIENAFAMPGGNIVLFTGIMKDMKGYPELLGILAHEVSHVNKKHTLRSLFRSLSTYLVVSIIINDVNAITTIVVEKAQDLRSLSYSRKLEREADMEGLEILFHNKIDPYGMVRGLENLNTEGEEAQSEFLSSHPITQNRIEYLREKISGATYTAEMNDSMQVAWDKLTAE